MSLSFTKKAIEVEFILLSGDFGGGNTKTIRGLPVTASIKKPGLPEKNSLDLAISGLPLADLESLTTLSFRKLQSQRNLIQVRAGDDNGDALSVVFAGEISNAFADFNAEPEIQLKVQAITGFYPQRIATPPTSIRGEATVESVMSGFVDSMGYTFVNNGVTASVSNTVFNGSPLDKVISLANEVGAEVIIDDNVVILQGAESGRTDFIPYVSPESGMFGYPTFNKDGIQVRCAFRPDIKLGGFVAVRSIVPRATGTWKVTKLSYDLHAYVNNGGKFECAFEAQYIGE